MTFDTESIERPLTLMNYNMIGLVLNIIGVAIIFIWGPPQPSFEGSPPLVLEDNTLLTNGLRAKEEQEAKRKQKNRHKLYSSLGILLILLGFVFQCAAEVFK